MAWSVNVKKLRDILSRYDDEAIVMVSNGPRDEQESMAFDIEDEVTYAYRNEDGEVFTDDDLTDGESVARAQRAVIIWPLME